MVRKQDVEMDEVCLYYYLLILVYPMNGQVLS